MRPNLPYAEYPGYPSKSQKDRYARQLREIERAQQQAALGRALGLWGLGNAGAGMALGAATGIDRPSAMIDRLTSAIPDEGRIAGGKTSRLQAPFSGDDMSEMLHPELRDPNAGKTLKDYLNDQFMDHQRNLTGPLKTTPDRALKVDKHGIVSIPDLKEAINPNQFHELDVSYKTTSGGKSKSKSKNKAMTVAQVVAAEAGGKTRAQRLSAMKDVFSAVFNRSQELGVPPEAVVGVTSEFNAYNKTMPAGTKSLVGLAQQAIDDVMAYGPTHNGTFYAQKYATGNLPKGLSKVKTAVDGHVYFSDPKGRAIRTATGVLPVHKSALPQTVAAIPSPAPRATPQQANALGMSAVGGTRDFMSSNMARVAKAAGTPPSTYAARITAPTPNSSNLMARTAATPSDARMRPDISARMADTLGNNSLTGGASADTMAARMSPMEPGANIAHLTNSQPSMASALGAPNPARFGVDPTNQAQAQWERIAPTSQDMALAHLTAPALGSTFPVRPDIIAPNTFSNQPMLKAPELQATVPPQPEIQQPQVSRVKTSSVKRAPLTLNVTKPADPFGGKTIGGIKPDERFSVDSIDSAIGGPRGATFSASLGLATFSRGPNIGYGVHNAQTGMTTLFDPSGNITGARRDKSTGGGFLGGLFGGGSSSSGKSLGGGGGGYGSSGNGNGGFGIGGAGSTRSR